VSVPENFFSRGANQHLFPSRLAAPTKHDQVDVVGFRAMDDLFHRMAHGNIGLHFDA